ncbi:MAG: helix-turn-helix domain-containing protein [Gemmatimonadaceae bacterium]
MNKNTCTRWSSASSSSGEVLALTSTTTLQMLSLALREVARLRHAPSVHAALSSVREGSPQAILIEYDAVAPGSSEVVGQLADRSTGPVVALYSGWTPEIAGLLLKYGRYGVQEVVDVSTKDGLCQLREILTRLSVSIGTRVAGVFERDLQEVSAEMRFFLTTVLRAAPQVTTARCLSRELGVNASTLVSRFYRARLPSPKMYLALTRLLYASVLLEDRRRSIAQVANQLRYSSPQSFGRHIRGLTGLTAGAFRERSYESITAHVVHQIIGKHRDTVQVFRPFTMRFEAPPD